jgi:uncharacterized protein YndB with AHSA1/START domain
MSRWVVSVERVIPASPEKIWALVADPRRHQDINGNDTVRDAFDVPATMSLGSTFGMNMDFGGAYTMANTVIEYDENRRIAWQARPAASGSRWRQLFGGRIWRYELEPVDGGTRVRESWDVSQEGQMGTRWLVRAYGSKTKVNMEKTLERIAALGSDGPRAG